MAEPVLGPHGACPRAGLGPDPWARTRGRGPEGRAMTVCFRHAPAPPGASSDRIATAGAPAKIFLKKVVKSRHWSSSVVFRRRFAAGRPPAPGSVCAPVQGRPAAGPMPPRPCSAMILSLQSRSSSEFKHRKGRESSEIERIGNNGNRGAGPPHPPRRHPRARPAGPILPRAHGFGRWMRGSSPRMTERGGAEPGHDAWRRRRRPWHHSMPSPAGSTRGSTFPVEARPAKLDARVIPGS